jgi:hypothetical protein
MPSFPILGPCTYHTSSLPLESCLQTFCLYFVLSCYLCLGWPQTHNLPTFASRVDGITGVNHHIQFIFVYTNSDIKFYFLMEERARESECSQTL